jgi:hypothetical protein
MVRECRSDMLESCIDNGEGQCTGCGMFMKGNKHGENSRRRDAVKAAVKDAVTPGEAKKLLSKLMNDSNANVQLKALALYLDRVLGKAITPIVTNESKEDDGIVPESVKKMLNDLL